MRTIGLATVRVTDVVELASPCAWGSVAAFEAWRHRGQANGKTVHAVMDNYATHKHPKVRAWLVRHPRWTYYFTPTSASWLKAVEGFFSALTRRRLKHGVFCSLVDLHAAINRYVAEHNKHPKPFAWTADPDRVLAAIARGKQVLNSLH